MSITPNELSFYFKNVQKSHNATSAFLDRYSDSPYDFLFFQELQGKIYRCIADINSPEGVEVFGTPIHPEWECLPPPSRDLQVAIYVHKRITSRFHITVNHRVFHHPNVFSVCSLTRATTAHFISLTFTIIPIVTPLHIFTMPFCVCYSFCHCSPRFG